MWSIVPARSALDVGAATRGALDVVPAVRPDVLDTVRIARSGVLDTASDGVVEGPRRGGEERSEVATVPLVVSAPVSWARWSSRYSWAAVSCCAWAGAGQLSVPARTAAESDGTTYRAKRRDVPWHG